MHQSIPETLNVISKRTDKTNTNNGWIYVGKISVIIKLDGAFLLFMINSEPIFHVTDNLKNQDHT